MTIPGVEPTAPVVTRRESVASARTSHLDREDAAVSAVSSFGRQEAIAALSGAPDGTFILRWASDGKSYALTLVHDKGQCNNYRVKAGPDGFRVHNGLVPGAKTISDVVGYLSRERLMLPCCLGSPYQAASEL